VNKIKTHTKIDRDIYACGQGLLKSVGLFEELEYCAYLTCCFIMFLHGTGVIYIYLVHVMELCVDFLVDEMKGVELYLYG
jgi:hypothetical protein